MKLRQLFENRGTTVGVCFGRWNPPHKGHKAAWEIAASFGTFYVGTNKNTEGPNDPLPYLVKLKAMETIWPGIAGHVIPEQSLFTLVSKIFAKHGENTHLKVATDEEWLAASLIKYNGKEGPHGYYKFASITQVPTPRLSSATALRAAVRAGDRDGFSDAAGVDADTPIKIGKKTVAFFDLVAHYLAKHPEKAKKVKKVAEHKKGVRAIKYTKKPVSPSAQHQKAKEKFQPIKPGVEKQTDECAGVGTITKQNSTGDVNKGTPYKNLKAFNLVKEIAGAFPSPSTREKWAKDAAASNAAEAKRLAAKQAIADAERLKVNNAIVDKEQRINYHPMPDNEVPVKEVAMRMQGSSAEEKAANAAAKQREAEEKAKHLAIVQAYVKIMAAGQPLPPKMQRSYDTMPDFRKEVDAALKAIPGQPGVVDLEQRRNYHLLPKNEQFAESSLDTYMAERAAYLAEAGMKKIDKTQKAAMKNASTLPALNQSTGSAYMNYRMGIAMAGAPDFPTKMEKDNWIGGDPLLSTYTDEEFEMVKAAAKQVGAGTIQNWSGKRSEEVADVNKTSTVAKIKRNKYGV